ncbi:HD domain-containing protein [Trichothermofontia sp.]
MSSPSERSWLVPPELGADPAAAAPRGTRSERIYHDPLHGAIVLDAHDPTEALLIRLIDTPAFQRLRRIRQLGPANLTFHGAEMSRFTHSLGVMAITRRAFDRLAKRDPVLQPYRAVALAAALLHDIGHGPFSHTSEEIFGNHHEQWTARILSESAPVRELLDAYDPSLLPQIKQVYHHQHPVPLIWQLVSSQLDCDRLDYLLRDSYFTGASYGTLDLDRLLMAMNFDPLTQQLVVARKGLTAVEHYLLVRYLMYAQVYNHPKNIAANWGLEQVFQRARELLTQETPTTPPFVDDTMGAWLTQPMASLTIAQYLAADDEVFSYHLHRWYHDADPILADLARRSRDRDLLKALDVTDLGEDGANTLCQMAQHHWQQQGHPPQYYLGLRVSHQRGYSLYQRGIKLLTADGLQEISHASPLVQTLIQPYRRLWLIYPRSLTVSIQQWRQRLRHDSHGV